MPCLKTFEWRARQLDPLSCRNPCSRTHALSTCQRNDGPPWVCSAPFFSVLSFFPFHTLVYIISISKQHAVAGRHIALAEVGTAAACNKSDLQIEFQTITVSFIMQPIYIYSCWCNIHKLHYYFSRCYHRHCLHPLPHYLLCMTGVTLQLSSLPSWFLPSVTYHADMSSGRLLIMYN